MPVSLPRSDPSADAWFSPPAAGPRRTTVTGHRPPANRGEPPSAAARVLGRRPRLAANSIAQARAHIARLPLASAALNYLADLIRGHCEKIRSPWRVLPAGKIAGIVSAVSRCDQRPGDPADGNGVHRTTVGRWGCARLSACRPPALPRPDRALKRTARPDFRADTDSAPPQAYAPGPRAVTPEAFR